MRELKLAKRASSKILRELEKSLQDPSVLEKMREMMEESERLRKECSQRGHPNSEYGGITYFGGRLTVRMYCGDCGPYTRNPSIEEEKGFNRMMNTSLRYTS